jgi:hypothetical protein
MKTKIRLGTMTLGALAVVAGCGGPGAHEGPVDVEDVEAVSGGLYGTTPSGWTKSKIGTITAPAVTVLYDPPTDTYQVDGAGTGLKRTGSGGDNVYYVQRSLTGNLQLTANVAELWWGKPNNVSGDPECGLMVRAQLGTTSSFMAWSNDRNTNRLLVRRTIGGPAETLAMVGASRVALARSGNDVIAYADLGSGTLSTIASATLSGLGAATSYGMFVSTDSAALQASCRLRGVQLR